MGVFLVNSAKNTSKYALQNINWVNTLFLILSPIIAAVLIVFHFAYEGWSWGAWALAIFFYFATGMSITAGYHRLFSHKAYQANSFVKLFFLLFGAATFQNSCLKWAVDHRRHHRHVDTEEDPYNINEGFFYAHMGWILLKEDPRYENDFSKSKDLTSDPLVMWQHKYYLPISVAVGMLLPLAIGFLCGFPLGGIALAGIGRIVFVHHATFLINSLCHKLGSQPYTDKNTARDSYIMALFTYGEGYHNFHHRFQFDYRNGIKWYHFDPSKWLINSLEWVGMARNKKRVPLDEILKAKFMMAQKNLENCSVKSLALANPSMVLLKEKIELTLARMEEVKSEIKRGMSERSDEAGRNLRAQKKILEKRMNDLARELQLLLKVWSIEIRMVGTPSISVN